MAVKYFYKDEDLSGRVQEIDVSGISTLAEVNADKPCGGIWTQKVNSRTGEVGLWVEPQCCEVHLLPWSHPKIEERS